MALSDVLLGNAQTRKRRRSSRNGRILRESTADLFAPSGATDPGPEPLPVEEIETGGLDAALGDMPAVDENLVRAPQDLDGAQALISAGDPDTGEVATTNVDTGETISAGLGGPPADAIISAGSPSSDEVATTNKRTGATITAGTGGPPSPGVPDAAPLETTSVEDALEGAELQRSGVSSTELRAARNKAGGTSLVDILASPAVQKALIGFGEQADGRRGRSALGETGRQIAESNAQSALRRRLEAGESVEEALQANDVAGISAEGQRAVIQQFQDQELAEEQQGLDRRRVDQADRRLDLREQQLDFQQDIRQDEFELAEDREQRLQQAQAFEEYVQQERIQLDQRAQRLEEEMQPLIKDLKRKQGELMDARIEDLRSGDGEIGQQLNSLNRVAASATRQAETIDQRLQQAETLQEGLVDRLPTDAGGGWFSGGTNVRSKARAVLNQMESGSVDPSADNFDMDEYLSNQGVPEEYQPDVKQAIRQQRNINEYQEQRERMAEVADTANKQVLSAMGAAVGSGPSEDGGEEDEGSAPEPGSSKDNPITPATVEELREIPSGTWVKNPNTGEVRPKQ